MTPRREAVECPVRSAVRWLDLEWEALPDTLKRELPRHFTDALGDIGKAMVASCAPAVPEPTEAAVEAALEAAFVATEADRYAPLPEDRDWMRVALRAAYAVQFGPAAPSGEPREGTGE